MLLITMIVVLTPLDAAEHTEIWIRCSVALVSIKKLEDKKTSGGENEIIRIFGFARLWSKYQQGLTYYKD